MNIRNISNSNEGNLIERVLDQRILYKNMKKKIPINLSSISTTVKGSKYIIDNSLLKSKSIDSVKQSEYLQLPKRTKMNSSLEYNFEDSRAYNNFIVKNSKKPEISLSYNNILQNPKNNILPSLLITSPDKSKFKVRNASNLDLMIREKINNVLSNKGTLNKNKKEKKIQNIPSPYHMFNRKPTINNEKENNKKNNKYEFDDNYFIKYTVASTSLAQINGSYTFPNIIKDSVLLCNIYKDNILKINNKNK
jgi:hypothetical protein